MVTPKDWEMPPGQSMPSSMHVHTHMQTLYRVTILPSMLTCTNLVKHTSYLFSSIKSHLNPS